MAGIYIHIPFCKQACTYCNFHFSTSLKQKNAVIEALKKEILLTNLITTDTGDIESIYFGGGTPSILGIDDLRSILDTMHKKFAINANAEITLEANPDDISESTLKQWRHIGINRLSLGVQSFSNPELQWMNRAHNATDSITSIEKIKDAGFSNFSIDLIYGSPFNENETLKKNLDTIISKGIPHLSCYALTVEPKTLLYNMVSKQKLPPIDADRQAFQFILIMDILKQAGYEHYEISNYAIPGMRSKHNSSYWQGKPYYGFGPAAHSFDGINTRRWNISNNALYVQSLLKDMIPYEEEILSSTQLLNEYIMTSLRTAEGLDLNRVQFEYGNELTSKIISQSQKYVESNKLVKGSGHLILTNEGKLFADGIASDLFF